MKNTSTDKLNISLVKAFGIIEFLAKYGAPINAAAISQKLQYNKATTYSLLRTLEELQYVSRDSDGCYNLSSKILEIGSLYNASNSLVQVFNLCCDTMLQKYPNCNFSLGDLGTSMKGIYLSILGSNESFVSVGTAFPLHATAVGKIILANSSDEFQDEFFKTATLTRYTNSTITDETSLREELKHIRQDGYCILHGELFPNFHCISVPIFASGHTLNGGISVRSTEQFIAEHKEALISDMLILSRNISSGLGYRIELTPP